MFFGVTTCAVSLCTTGAIDISSNVSGVIGSVLLFDTLSSVILNDPSISSNASIASGLCLAILFVCGLYHNCLCLVSVLSIV